MFKMNEWHNDRLWLAWQLTPDASRPLASSLIIELDPSLLHPSLFDYVHASIVPCVHQLLSRHIDLIGAHALWRHRCPAGFFYSVGGFTLDEYQLAYLENDMCMLRYRLVFTFRNAQSTANVKIYFNVRHQPLTAFLTDQSCTAQLNKPRSCINVRL